MSLATVARNSVIGVGIFLASEKFFSMRGVDYEVNNMVMNVE